MYKFKERDFVRREKAEKHALILEKQEEAKQREAEDEKKRIIAKKENRSRPQFHDDLIKNIKNANR